VSRRSLDTALYRLRKLLDIEAAIDSSNARVALASTVCWTDVRAFELVCDRIAVLARDGGGLIAEIDRCEQRLSSLYRGPLGHDDDPPVVLRARERLTRMRARAVADLQRLWAGSGQQHRADRLVEASP
jgi:DNA-binding SARP family transcriptional activator